MFLYFDFFRVRLLRFLCELGRSGWKDFQIAESARLDWENQQTEKAHKLIVVYNAQTA